MHGFATPPAPIWRRFCATNYGRSSAITKRPRSAPACSTSSTCCWSPATWCATAPRCAPNCSTAISHIFVDEFQDTDPLQAEILLLLAADDPAESDWHRARPLPGKLFIVGDPKQSIYRFRRADVALYQEVKRRLLECGAELEHLTVSFRATPELQAAVNAAFAPLMPSESPTQPAYSPLMPFRADCATQPSLVVLPVPAPYSDRGFVTKRQIDESTARCGRRAGAMAGRGERMDGDHARPARSACRDRAAPHLHAFSALQQLWPRRHAAYVRALEARHIAHVLVKGGSFNEREEVEALRNALGAIERPDDELAVFATLRGPLFALDDGALLRFRAAAGSLHPFRKLLADLPAELTGDWRRARRAARAAAAGATAGRLRRPSRACSPRCARTRRLQSGRPASRRWPT